MTIATSPGKIILFGEHAVVYGRPAIAAPISHVRAQAVVEDGVETVRLIAPDLGMAFNLADADDENALAAAVRRLETAADLTTLPPLTITVTSQIPIASGLGSGAAITSAIIRALASHLGLEGFADNESVSNLTYEVEKIYHGTPSGIDNTVVSYEQPVYFVRQQPRNRIETFAVARPLRLLVADTGVSSSTKLVVGDVRRRWQAERDTYERIFDECGRIADAARSAIEGGDVVRIGRFMIQNQRVLEEMEVSSPALERLIAAALKAGALGAKLSGAGRGGNMIALVEPEMETAVADALRRAGATHVLTSTIE